MNQISASLYSRSPEHKTQLHVRSPSHWAIHSNGEHAGCCKISLQHAAESCRMICSVLQKLLGSLTVSHWHHEKRLGWMGTQNWTSSAHLCVCAYLCPPPHYSLPPPCYPSSPSLSLLNRTTFRQAAIWLQWKHTTVCVYCTFRARGNTFTGPPFPSFSSVHLSPVSFFFPALTFVYTHVNFHTRRHTIRRP